MKDIILQVKSDMKSKLQYSSAQVNVILTRLVVAAEWSLGKLSSGNYVSNKYHESVIKFVLKVSRLWLLMQYVKV